MTDQQQAIAQDRAKVEFALGASALANLLAAMAILSQGADSLYLNGRVLGLLMALVAIVSFVTWRLYGDEFNE